ncbi:MAG: ABC transporter ATP-binding protein [Chloroflexi bacterium]|nr:ABC transporter ATP-binding protein [Chloroflexota bacterium]
MPTVSEPAAIELTGVSVRYRLPRERVASLKEFAIRWAQGRVEYVDLWALTGVSLEVPPGEILGVIGRNGAGKSTLLKTIARVLHPTAGRVIVRGRVAALLDLGAGFHAELTGRENVYLYGTLLGHTRAEVDAVFDDVVGFAELEAFIDAPLRTYSTGMIARLGFAVATCRFAEVLLVDEVLAVGDASFQEKCLKRMDDYRRRGAAMVFVSHSADTVRQVCHRAAWLDLGHLAALGPANEVLGAYFAA